MKTVWFDTETTGVVPGRNEIVQIAGMIEVDGEIVERFEYFQRPKNVDNVEPIALKVQGKTLDEIMAYPQNGNIYKKMNELFNRNVQKFVAKDKLMPAGQNVYFDKQFMFALWKQFNDNYLGSYLSGGCIDVLTASAMAVEMGLMQQPIDARFRPSFKLEAIARTLGVDLENAHSALDDIEATRNCYVAIKSLMNGVSNN